MQREHYIHVPPVQHFTQVNDSLPAISVKLLPVQL